MKLLIIIHSSVFPDQLSTGGKQAVYNMVDYLRHYIDISILYWGNDINTTGEQQLKAKWNNVQFFPFRKKRKEQIGWNVYSIYKLFDELVGRALKKNQQYRKYKILKEINYQPEFLKYVLEVISSGHFDIVQTEFYNAIDLVYIIPDNVKKVFVQHEIRYVRNQLLFNDEASADLLFLMKRQKYKEIQAMNNYDSVITLSDKDKSRLVNDGIKTDIVSSPVTVAISRNNSKDFPAPTNAISFLGGYAHPPNVEGIDWFLKNVWPIVIKRNENISFNIIGDWPVKIIKEIEAKHKRVKFLGHVEDLGTVLPGTIMIVPIFIGSGIRMKILDAINYGCPIITTTIGIEGLEFEHNKACFITDAAVEFAQYIFALYENEALRNELIKKSREIYYKRYSIESLGNKRLSVYKDIAYS